MEVFGRHMETQKRAVRLSRLLSRVIPLRHAHVDPSGIDRWSCASYVVMSICSVAGRRGWCTLGEGGQKSETDEMERSNVKMKRAKCPLNCSLSIVHDVYSCVVGTVWYFNFVLKSQ